MTKFSLKSPRTFKPPTGAFVREPVNFWFLCFVLLCISLPHESCEEQQLRLNLLSSCPLQRLGLVSGWRVGWSGGSLFKFPSLGIFCRREGRRKGNLHRLCPRGVLILLANSKRMPTHWKVSQEPALDAEDSRGLPLSGTPASFQKARDPPRRGPQQSPLRPPDLKLISRSSRGSDRLHKWSLMGSRGKELLSAEKH